MYTEMLLQTADISRKGYLRIVSQVDFYIFIILPTLLIEAPAIEVCLGLLRYIERRG